MINKVRTSNSITKIFQYLNETRKLELIKYSKKIQNKIGISPINYILFSKRHILYEKDGQAKEIDLIKEHIIYEGGYLNGHRNGKGKEYDEYDRLLFEGEYLNGKRNGHGKEYLYGILKFEGEYLNGKRCGKGKEYYAYDDENILKFEGEYLNGKIWNGIGYGEDNQIIYEIKNGKGWIKEYYFGTLIFEGEYINGEKNGKAKEYYKNELLKVVLMFDGEYKNGKKWNGKGYNYNDNKFYEIEDGEGYMINYNQDREFSICEYKNGVRNGNGREFDEFGRLIFEGQYLNDAINGKGKEISFNRITFRGMYLNGMRHGKGIEYDGDDKEIFVGEYLYGYKIKGQEFINGKIEYEGFYLFNNKWEGKGFDEQGNVIYELIKGKGKVKEYLFENLKFEGEYLNGLRHGKGKEYYDKDSLIFEGEYLNGKRKGKGKGKEYNGEGKLLFEGEYLNGKKNGYGREYSEVYGLSFEGEFVNGKRNGHGKYYWNGQLEFEGEFSNGYQIRGKEYRFGELVYEGEYKIN